MPEPAPGATTPTAAHAALERGRALMARGELSQATVALREALRLQPDLHQARTPLGLALYGLGDFDGAIDELRMFLRAQPAAGDARLTLARALMARHDWAGARAELELVLSERPDLIEANYAAGIVRYRLGDLDGAIDAYHRLLAQAPEQPDARYNLALMLKLARRDAEATREFLVAAEAGVATAQYFVGAAYAAGVGAPRDLAKAITWWFRAADQGVIQAEEALSQVRQAATGRGKRGPIERAAAEQAFRDFRADLWKQYPTLNDPSTDINRSGEDTVGAALLRRGRTDEAVGVLIREAWALSEPAQRQLAALYEQGVDGRLPAHDPRILAYFTAAAAEGEPRARIELARIYAGGLGVTPDLERALTLLRTTPHEDAQSLLRELSPGLGPASIRP
ncbi:MAG TPA: tetratricopeptide repeat protein [Methylomirabilota bacterium]|nr:tetratricopeptide repeat protein [Methylomirabilota bacterium]